MRGTVDAGCLVLLLIDARNSRKEDHAVVADIFPEVNKQHDSPGIFRVSQEVDPDIDHAEIFQQNIDHARLHGKERIEDRVCNNPRNKEREEGKGLNEDEYAFYTALVKNPIVLKEMKDEVLIQLAHELTETVRKSRTVDWDKKESARAYMRKVVKRLLRKYEYPPKEADEAVATVIKQAELMSANLI